MGTKKREIRIIIGILLLTVLLIPSFAQKRFPGKTWEVIDKPEDLGYSSAKLKAAENFAGGIQTAGVVIVVDGAILYEWGNVKTKYWTHSCRKSFMSALYGIYVDRGIINLEKTLKDIGIDDEPSLTEQEKMATIRDCMKARSGVYHTAEAESEGMHNLKPSRGTYQAGQFWLYNNWDFNVLYTIFEQLTGKKMFHALKEDIFDPIGVEDFVIEDGRVFSSGRSIHPSYLFLITARDMARFGLLMLRTGSWNGKQIVSEEWVKESTRYHSDATIYRSDGYSYMWWALHKNNKFPHFPNVDLNEGTYSARGAGGHYIVVIPDYDMVVVHRVNTFERNRVSGSDFGKLLKLILDAKM